MSTLLHARVSRGIVYATIMLEMVAVLALALGV